MEVNSKEAFVKPSEENFFSHCIKKLQNITAMGCIKQYILKQLDTYLVILSGHFF